MHMSERTSLVLIKKIKIKAVMFPAQILLKDEVCDFVNTVGHEEEKNVVPIGSM